MPWYLLGLVAAIACLGLIDWRFKLAFFYDWRRTSLTLAIMIGLFAVWDLLGIYQKIFYHGGSDLTLPIRLLPEFPIEELFFLMLLNYVALIAYRFFERRQR